ncbi:nuclear transport factor 2-like protein [Caldovatus aquaticus]|uniref:SnoaL-like domain-containing protein n=1 Tax=Caldovatus aquaticus TaxID=2865671 RepID=A0ABS7F160_9PROT|nr:hypothetical protein [Caldovatus aquaticus]MBW8269355.1 hypothetical protein [Caldovatus aquaticus]
MRHRRGRLVVVLATAQVQPLATGEIHACPKAEVFRLAGDGRIAEFRDYYDTATALARCCAAPPGGG